MKILEAPDFNFSSTAQSRAFWAGSVKGGCSGLKKYMSDLPNKFTISSRTLKSVIPFSLKNFAAKLVPARSAIELSFIEYALMRTVIVFLLK